MQPLVSGDRLPRLTFRTMLMRSARADVLANAQQPPLQDKGRPVSTTEQDTGTSTALCCKGREDYCIAGSTVFHLICPVVVAGGCTSAYQYLGMCWFLVILV